MNRISRCWHQNRVAGAGDRHSQVGNAFFRTNRCNRFGIRVQVDIVVALVPVGDSEAQFVNASGKRIAVVGFLLRRFNQLVDNMVGGRHIRIPQTKVDDIFPAPTGLIFELVDNAQNIRWKALNSGKFSHDFKMLRELVRLPA